MHFFPDSREGSRQEYWNRVYAEPMWSQRRGTLPAIGIEPKIFTQRLEGTRRNQGGKRSKSRNPQGAWKETTRGKLLVIQTKLLEPEEDTLVAWSTITGKCSGAREQATGSSYTLVDETRTGPCLHGALNKIWLVLGPSFSANNVDWLQSTVRGLDHSHTC